ncbi:Fumarylacetoacetase [Choiromyces venosus 120613-1]|uniref:Fumarylacetoacetase n=1 Tax=Choiromyces venosus 120613-1 TaxID=1336337 RepID=A0A3N4JEL8_9PEZI|nr:Fumarylacetoacetase [Choiromyces venosus 120613-1]
MSWLPVPSDHYFSVNNIPFGIISTPSNPTPRPAVAIGEYVLDLQSFTSTTSVSGFSQLPEFTKPEVFTFEKTLNRFASLGRATHRLVRGYLQQVLSSDTPYPEILKDNAEAQEKCLINTNEEEVRMHLPMDIGDYTDFYAGRNHAFNVGALFRGRENAMQPNYEHLPVGYHGRASSVVVSGTRVRRPRGQVMNPASAGSEKVPVLAPCGKLDFELELAAFIGKDSDMGSSVGVDEAGEYLFGVVVMNDWSARDIQAWEYIPLGPFTSKSFATSISSWVVLMDALEPLRARPLERGTKVPLLPYLQESNSESVYDIPLTVSIKTPSGTHKISQTSSSNLLFSFSQMIAHHTVTGCPLRTGDLLGTGTISGTDTQGMGSLLEMSANGTQKVALGESGEVRRFLEDGDVVVLAGGCRKVGVGFGECVGEVLPAQK